jgi:hypothetical protein
MMQVNHDSQCTIHGHIKALLTDEQYTELQNGAYILIKDNAMHFTSWLLLDGVIQRIAFHESLTPIYSIYSALLGECVFATRKHGDEVCTWMQLERYRNSYDHFIQHTFCYLYYRWTDRNVGPLGTSHHTDQRPIIIEREKVQSGPCYSTHYSKQSPLIIKQNKF